MLFRGGLATSSADGGDLLAAARAHLSELDRLDAATAPITALPQRVQLARSYRAESARLLREFLDKRP